MMIKAVKIEPGKRPAVVNVENTLEAWQKAVGGYIEVLYPFPDSVGLICNEEAKLIGLPFNRGLCAGGELYDVICGTFYAVGLTEEDFGSLTDDQARTICGMYHNPEVLMRIDQKIVNKQVTPAWYAALHS